jgi:hypothetical protein
MFLLSRETLKLFKLCINLGAFFRVIPYQWDEKSKSLVLTPKERRIHERILSWDFAKYIHFLHLIFIIVRLWQSLSGQTHDFAFYITQFTYFLVFVLASLVQLLMIQNKIEILVFFNRFLQFAKYIERK